MTFVESFSLPFLQFRCDCCGGTFGGDGRYKAGMLQCQACAGGDHRHKRKAA